ncbi:MAG: biopolymer transporter ExbB [Pseudomonadales bacterium 32-61-5]|uniref:Biopolymer transport protein ExbB n=1 Tax=Halopseudomonas yangmingensis TaxID=1720063 RepID=A0A1I4QDI5_9GAMM|nr:MAG: biopolymer transporter ExbB [Pseudomonadales bacterium 32-61-5]SFM38077.1 biopolymer transport protein ExbB [Halopseudomonas yangmingensis]
MWELISAGGWLMLPILLSSVIALAIVLERLWTLRGKRVAPAGLVANVWRQVRDGKLDANALKTLRAGSPLGEVLAAGLSNAQHGRDVMKECIQEAASRVIHELERYLNTLGTIAAITPLLGLLGTVIGMIDVFNAILLQGTGNTAVLAGGISKALITTAAGLTVAIPAVFFHRFFMRRVDELVVAMEQEATRLVEVVQGNREADFTGEQRPAAPRPPASKPRSGKPRKEG